MISQHLLSRLFSQSKCSAYQSKPSRLWTPAIVIDAMHLDAPEVVQLDHTVHVNISQWSSPGHMEPSKHGASGEHFKWVNFYGKYSTFVYSDMSCYARLQSLNSDSKQTTGQSNLKPVRVTVVGLEVFEEVSTTYDFFSMWSAKSSKSQNQRLPYKLVD